MKNEETENLDFDDVKIEVKGKISGDLENVDSTNSNKNRVVNHVPTNTIPNRSTGGLGSSSGLSKAGGLGASGALPGDNRLPSSNKLPGSNGIENNNGKSLNYNNNLNNNVNGNNSLNKNNVSSNNKNLNKNNTPNNKNNNKDKKASSGINKKRDNLKNKWDNRPKTPKDFSDKAKKSLKNGANKAKDGLKNGAKNRFNNSKLGKAINSTKETVNKVKEAKEKAKKVKLKAKTFAAFLKSPVGLAIMGMLVGLLVIFVLVIAIPSMFAAGSPLVGGEVEEEENYEKYSNTDQKTIDSLQTIYKKHSSGIPEYAMAATLYAYTEEMQNGNVTALRGKTNNEQEDDAEATDDEDCVTNNTDSSTTNSDCIDDEIEDDEDDLISDDPYLELLRQKKYRRKFKKLLIKSEGGKDALTEYLKDTWFTKDKGYKELFDGVEDDDVDDLKEAIIDDILDQIDDFKGYFYNIDSCSTTYSSQSAGSVEVNEMLKGNILVDVKVSSCTTGKNVWDCESMYDSPIDMAKYVKGVTYEEIGVSGSSDIEKVKAQMVAAKSYVIGRSKSMGWGVRQDSAGNYIVTIRANTNDQDYCDIDVGCKSGKTKVRSGSNHRAAVDSATRAKLDEAWEATKNVYIQNSNGSLKGEFCNDRTGDCDFCKKGTCLAHVELEKYSSVSYDKILIDQYSSYSLVTVEGEFASAVVGTADTSCSNNTDSSNFIYYAQNDYANTAFCGRTLSEGKNGCAKGNSICTSGCGVTSAAMVAATLTQNSSITPETVNSSATVGTDCGGYGTNASLFTHIASNNGLETKNISTKKQIKSVLDSGGLVIANVAGVFGSGTYGTTGGHYVVIRGYGDKDVYIADPWQNSSMKNYCDEYNSKNQCTKLHTDFDTFVSNVKNKGGAGFIAITGGTPFSENSNDTTDNSNSGEKGKATGTLGYPVKGVKGCDGSDWPNYSSGNYHGGSDINSSANGGKKVDGKTVVAADGGKVIVKKELNRSYGNYVEIDHGNGYTTLYAHMQAGSIVVKQGEKVSKGQKIGLVGSTGNSTGPHLHIELRIGGSYTNTKNPCDYIGKNKSYVK